MHASLRGCRTRVLASHLLTVCALHVCALRTQVANGMGPREAWLACNRPNGEKGIQNIRKRGAKLRKAPATVAAAPSPLPVLEAAPAAAATPGSSGSKGKKPFRLSTNQVQKQHVLDHEMKAKFDEVYVAATNEWQRLCLAGLSGSGEATPNQVAARYSTMLPPGCTRKLTGRSLKNAILQGRVGVAPGRRGPKPKLDDDFVASVSEFAQLQQVSGNEQKPRQLVQTAVASVAGTAHEQNLSTSSQKINLLRRVRREHSMMVTASTTIDDRRWQWLTSSNMTTWFEGYKQSLADWKFIPGVPDDKFEVLVIDARKLHRMWATGMSLTKNSVTILTSLGHAGTCM